MSLPEKIKYCQDVTDRLWFRIRGSAMSLKSKTVMEDGEGGPVVGYQKKLLSWHNTAYITIDQDGQYHFLKTGILQYYYQVKQWLLPV